MPKKLREPVNSLTHWGGAILALIGLIILLILGWGTPAKIISLLIYGISLIFLFSASATYHMVQVKEKALEVFRKIDHAAIYFLIAGTYTPFLLIYMNNEFGITILSVLWGLTVLGIFFKIRFTGKFEIISTIIYLLMGWIMISGGRRFFDNLPVEVLIFIFIGGGLYSVGVFFYLWDKYSYTHAVWHLFVLGGAVSHYIAVFLAM